MTYRVSGLADAGIAIIVGLLIGLIAAELVKPNPQPANAQQSAQTCPAGSYLIGYKDDANTQPICKLEPTGCPYGDSIPLGPECDKHAPAGTAEKQQAIAEHNAPFNTAQPQAAQCGGK